MTLQAPEWRVRTRPCPFYQRGRCLFADSCNFLHTVSVRPLPGVTIIDSPQKLEQATTNTALAPPILLVDSPHPRSPRLSGLLHALRDVIGDDPEEQTLDSSLEELETWVESVETDDDGILDQEDMENPYPGIAFSDDSTAQSRVASSCDQYPPHEADDDDAGQDDVEENRLTARSLSYTHGYSDMLPEPPPEYGPKQASHRRSTSMSGLCNRSLLNRPSHLQLDSLITPEIGAEEKDSEVFIDSGYAEGWQPPSALALTPPRTPVRNSSMLDLLASPFCSPSTEMGIGIHWRSSLRSAVGDDVVSKISLNANHPSPRHDNAPMTDGLAIKNGASPTRPGSDVEVITTSQGMDVIEPARGDAGSDTTEGSKAVVAYRALTLPNLAVHHNDDGQSETSAIYTENASAGWKIGLTPHHGVSPGSTEASVGFVHRANEMTYVSEVTTVTTVELDPEDSASNDHTPNLTEDVGDDNTSSKSSRSSPRLAYLATPTLSVSECDMDHSSCDAYSGVASPPGDATYSSMLLQLESSFNPPFSNTSVNVSSQEQVIIASTDTQKHTPSSNSSMLSPVETQASPSYQNQDAFTSVRSPCADSVQLRTSSGTLKSRKVPFSWRSTGKSQSRSNNLLLSRRASLQGSSDIFFGRNSSYENPPDSALSAYGSMSGIRPLRLSSSTFSQHHHSSNGSVTSHSLSTNRTSMLSSVSSAKSPIYNHLLSPTRISPIPEHIRNSIFTSQESIPSPLSDYSLHLRNFGEPRSAPVSPNSWRYPGSSNPHHEQMTFDRTLSRASESSLHRIDEQADGYAEKMTTRELTQVIPRSAPPVSQRFSEIAPAVHAIATPKPTLFFAIASDKVDEVREVLKNGHAGPNEAIGPQSALEFALTNDQLTHKMEIVKLLLAYGANPTVIRNRTVKQRSIDVDSQSSPLGDMTEVTPEVTPSPAANTTILDAVDAATRYYVEKAEAPDARRASALMHRSSFRPLTRVRYEIVGQDRALEQLFKVLSIHTRHLSATPIVVLLCGPSGHGKSLLARKFGSLLDVPTHTVNMTTLKSTHDLWKSYSMSPYETPTTCTLAEFLINNEGKRCVVVLDEIEKTEDEKALWSLLMPWELGRCSIEAGSRHVDVRNVVWLGTSNIGHDMILKYQENRECPQEPFCQEEYNELMGLLRPKVSERLGASVLSRVTTVLPFVPFTVEEKKAICSEALYTLAGEVVRELTPQAVGKMVEDALVNYCSEEGARSLYRAISNHLVDTI